MYFSFHSPLLDKHSLRLGVYEGKIDLFVYLLDAASDVEPIP